LAWSNDLSHFIRDLTRQNGLTPGKWLLAERIKKAGALLRHGDMKVGEAAHALGFSDAFVFSRAFKRVTGKTPASWRNQPR
jgi:AraC-like DNA-binding protein